MSSELKETISARDVIEAVAGEGGAARLLGGRAVAACGGERIPDSLRRFSSDIDIIIRKQDRKAVKLAMETLGCLPATEFNLLNGKERMIFYAGETKIDVFIERFRMCHVLDLSARIPLCPFTLPPADLLLTKLQVVKLERKDMMDTAALLLTVPQGVGNPEAIDTAYLGRLLGADWGLWRTSTNTLASVRNEAAALCSSTALGQVLCEAIDMLESAIESAPRSLAWKMRAVLGERTPWYELPEEPEVRADPVRRASASPA
ncbi:MAG TPA: hypothetical protein VMA37_07140 [Acetobacteraceae bacterium]|nr:hypothetical protein [Acetobacteraceae bacterium]